MGEAEESIRSGAVTERKKTNDDPKVTDPSKNKAQDVAPRKEYTIDDFDTVAVIGQGGYAIVRIVTHKKTGEVYALKQLAKCDLTSQVQQQMVVNEIRVMSRSDCPWVAKMFDAWQDEQFVYMLMEYLPGGDMMKHLIDLHTFSEETTKFYVAELVAAVAYVHDHLNCVHRDVKPDNILLGTNGHIKLLDFGLSKLLSPYKKYMNDAEAWTKSGITNGPMTHRPSTHNKTSHFADNLQSPAGTPDYMAPEVHECKVYDRSVDWWSVGIIMYEMLFGGPPLSDAQHRPEFTARRVMNWRRHLNFPKDPEVTIDAKDFMKRLLTSSELRMKNFRQIQRHPWLKNIQWHDLHRQKAHIIPLVRYRTDHRNFDSFEPDTQLKFELSKRCSIPIAFYSSVVPMRVRKDHQRIPLGLGNASSAVSTASQQSTEKLASSFESLSSRSRAEDNTRSSHRSLIASGQCPSSPKNPIEASEIQRSSYAGKSCDAPDSPHTLTSDRVVTDSSSKGAPSNSGIDSFLPEFQDMEPLPMSVNLKGRTMMTLVPLSEEPSQLHSLVAGPQIVASPGPPSLETPSSPSVESVQLSLESLAPSSMESRDDIASMGSSRPTIQRWDDTCSMDLRLVSGEVSRRASINLSVEQQPVIRIDIPKSPVALNNLPRPSLARTDVQRAPVAGAAVTRPDTPTPASTPHIEPSPVRSPRNLKLSPRKAKPRPAVRPLDLSRVKAVGLLQTPDEASCRQSQSPCRMAPESRSRQQQAEASLLQPLPQLDQFIEIGPTGRESENLSRRQADANLLSGLASYRSRPKTPGISNNGGCVGSELLSYRDLTCRTAAFPSLPEAAMKPLVERRVEITPGGTTERSSFPHAKNHHGGISRATLQEPKPAAQGKHRSKAMQQSGLSSPPYSFLSQSPATAGQLVQVTSQAGAYTPARRPLASTSQLTPRSYASPLLSVQRSPVLREVQPLSVGQRLTSPPPRAGAIKPWAISRGSASPGGVCSTPQVSIPSWRGNALPSFRGSALPTVGSPSFGSWSPQCINGGWGSQQSPPIRTEAWDRTTSPQPSHSTRNNKTGAPMTPGGVANPRLFPDHSAYGLMPSSASPPSRTTWAERSFQPTADLRAGPTSSRVSEIGRETVPPSPLTKYPPHTVPDLGTRFRVLDLDARIRASPAVSKMSSPRGGRRRQVEDRSPKLLSSSHPALVAQKSIGASQGIGPASQMSPVVPSSNKEPSLANRPLTPPAPTRPAMAPNHRCPASSAPQHTSLHPTSPSPMTTRLTRPSPILTPTLCVPPYPHISNTTLPSPRMTVPAPPTSPLLHPSFGPQHFGLPAVSDSRHLPVFADSRAHPVDSTPIGRSHQTPRTHKCHQSFDDVEAQSPATEATATRPRFHTPARETFAALSEDSRGRNRPVASAAPPIPTSPRSEVPRSAARIAVSPVPMSATPHPRMGTTSPIPPKFPLDSAHRRPCPSRPAPDAEGSTPRALAPHFPQRESEVLRNASVLEGVACLPPPLALPCQARPSAAPRAVEPPPLADSAICQSDGTARLDTLSYTNGGQSPRVHRDHVLATRSPIITPSPCVSQDKRPGMRFAELKGSGIPHPVGILK